MGRWEEVMHQMKKDLKESDARARAVAWTWHADMKDVEEALECVAPVLSGAPLIVVGISNGCVPAVELARKFEAQAIWLASGVPAQARLC